MRHSVASRHRKERAHLLDGAGHWVQQEQSEEVSRLLVQFLQRKLLNAQLTVPVQTDNSTEQHHCKTELEQIGFRSGPHDTLLRLMLILWLITESAKGVCLKPGTR